MNNLILPDYTDEQCREIAARPSQSPMAGEWVLRGPNGCEWSGKSPLECMRAEAIERIPAIVQLARVRVAMMDLGR